MWVFFLLAGVIYNSLTRISNAPAWLNYILIAVVSCGGLAVMFAYDYGMLFATGVRGIPYIPAPPLRNGCPPSACPSPRPWPGSCASASCLSCPCAAVASRVLFRKTGSAWLGGFLTSFVACRHHFHMVTSI